MASWKDVVVSPITPLRSAIEKIDASALQVALILNIDGTLAGMLTDGDVRRAILKGQDLEVPVSEVMNSNPTSVVTSTPREEMLSLMRIKMYHHLPLVDNLKRVVGMVTLDELVGIIDRPNWVILMAGGLGKRLQSLTSECPKPLLMVGGKPILENILINFVDQGFKQIFLAVNYKAEMIQNHFGTGDRWGVKVKYLHENIRLGTAGALSLLPEKPSEPIVVMNGDLLTRVNFDNLLQFHNAQGSAATMVVREYDLQVPYGVIQLDNTRIKAVEEKPVHKFFVNAGIYVLSPEVLTHLPAGTYFDMPTLFEQLIASGKTTAAYPLHEYWLDIGRIEEFERAQLDIRNLSGN